MLDPNNNVRIATIPPNGSTLLSLALHIWLYQGFPFVDGKLLTFVHDSVHSGSCSEKVGQVSQRAKPTNARKESGNPF